MELQYWMEYFKTSFHTAYSVQNITENVNLFYCDFSKKAKYKQ